MHPSRVPVRKSISRSSARSFPRALKTGKSEKTLGEWSARVAIIGAIGALVGGAWSAARTVYKEWLEPRITPALVQAEVLTKSLGETDCCRIYEIATKFENKGKRAVIIQASHQTVGARKLVDGLELPSTEADIRTATQLYVASRMPGGPNFGYLEDHNAHYVGVKLDSVPLLLTAGNPIAPQGYLSESEVHIHRSVAFVPKDYPFFFVRGTMHVSHVQGRLFHWHWVIEPQGLLPKALPWLPEKDNEFIEKVKCLNSRTCERSLREEIFRLQQEYISNDGLNYTMNWAGDFAAAEGRKDPSR